MAPCVKTAISLHESLYNEVNKLAKEMHVSRSKLFVMAVEDFIKKQENKNLLEQINKAFTDQPDSDELKIHSEMRKKQLKNLEKEEW